MSDTYNISAIQGSTLLLNLNLTNSDGSYINLSGYGIRGFVREKYSSTGILFNLNPSINSSYVSGLIQISGTATGLAKLPIGKFVFDIELSGSNEYILKALRGYFLISPEATY
jgi:hypothetical protein